MEIKIFNSSNIYWQKLIEFSKASDWDAGIELSMRLSEDNFLDWERACIAIENDTIVGYSIFVEIDSCPKSKYYPWVGYIFVDSNHRGKRISEKMIEHLSAYAKGFGFENIYIQTGFEGLYEKFGFKHIDDLQSDNGGLEKVFTRPL